MNAAEPMSQIQKFSFLYDAAEDRVACDTEATDGAISRLWMTQRFCRNLVAAVVDMLEKGAGASGEGRQTLLQSWQQAAAMDEFGRTPGVRPTPQSVSGLVRTAQLTPKTDAISIAFEFGADETRFVTLAVPQMRQMLGALHQVHVAAGWPLGFWPAWVTDPVAAAAPTATVN